MQPETTKFLEEIIELIFKADENFIHLNSRKTNESTKNCGTK